MPRANEQQVGGKHYATPIQHWDFVLANNIPYMEAQIMKYLLRWRKKNGIEDLRKARHFLDKLIEHEVETGAALAEAHPDDELHDSGVPTRRYVDQG